MKFNGQSGAGMVPMFIGRAPHQWQHVLAFLDSLPQRDAAATGERSAGAAAAAAGSQAIPVGNHGDNRRSIK